ncbi:hypothetical protein FB107DRAFT_211198 [Schizophyllum commune]
MPLRRKISQPQPSHASARSATALLDSAFALGTSPTARPFPSDSPTPGMASATASTPFSSSGSSTPSESSSVSSITSNSSVPQNPCPPRTRTCAGSPGGGGPNPPNPPNPGPNHPPGIRRSDRHLNYAEMGALRALLLLDQERNGAIGTFYNPPTP